MTIAVDGGAPEEEPVQTGIVRTNDSIRSGLAPQSSERRPHTSQDDITLTKLVIAAGKLMGFSCLDHVIIGGQNGASYSMREEGIVDFDPANYGLVAENGERSMEDQKRYEGGRKTEEVTLHFGKGTAEPFTTKDGKESPAKQTGVPEL